ncbi:glycosyltransferase [Hydrocarboniclastica marina]|uniref:Glycosyltransferase n=1 Tax=Hydrocarboniclastica marina TaxID=2259620 RepID=A0A4P7XIE8_9ALTE|nr:glycosyltransferase [Hydrocarboniclastica marina]QCF26294.1 glycosyltransferase [Hydrocarboniclastica marina]
MKVLHLIDSGGLYGAEKVLLALVKEQQRQGLEPMILSAGSPDIAEKAIEAEAVRLGLPVKPWRMRPGLNMGETRKILDWAKAQGFTLLHSHGYKFNILLALQRRNTKGFATITTLHGYVHARRYSKMWVYELLDRWAIRTFDAVVLVGEAMKSEIGGSKRLQRTARVILNGLDVEGLQKKAETPLDARLLAFCQKHTPLIVGVGRLSREKGFDILLEAFPELKRHYPEAGLLIVGEGNQRLILEGLVESLGIEECVLMPGFTDTIPSLLRCAAVLAMPSRTEGLPVTLLEAMSIGTPIVASAVGAIPQTLSQGKGGRVIEEVTAGTLSDELQVVLSDETGAQARANWAKEEVAGNFSATAMADQYQVVYQGIQHS